MKLSQKIEVFTAGCPLCEPVVKLVKEMAGPDSEVVVYDLREDGDTKDRMTKAIEYGVHKVPAVVVDGRLADCCSGQTPITRETLEKAGIGR